VLKYGQTKIIFFCIDSNDTPAPLLNNALLHFSKQIKMEMAQRKMDLGIDGIN